MSKTTKLTKKYQRIKSVNEGEIVHHQTARFNIVSIVEVCMER